MPVTDTPDTSLTVDEAADLVNLPPATLRYYRYLGQGPPSYKIGRRIRYDRSELLKWFEEQKRATSSGGDKEGAPCS